jgi:hypothetical protein
MLTNIIFQNRLYCEVQFAGARLIENGFILTFVSSISNGFEMTYYADNIDDTDALFIELFQLLENASKNEKVLTEKDIKLACLKAVDYANS